MATHARQQYFADENSLSKERREFSIADEIQQKIDSVEEWAQVNKIETVKVNWTALVPDIAKAVNVEVPDVIDNLYTVAADDALSAKQWKLLYDYIQNLQTIGRFLSNWDSATWLPITNPSESPYQYKAWDYYRVSNVAVSPASNYKPDGSSYTIWVASTTVETLPVAVSDLYLYDGTDWILLSNSWSGIAVDSSLSTTSTNPVENRVITNALNGKHPWAISNVMPSNPVEWMLWYDTISDELKVCDGSNWTWVGWGDVLVSTQANNIFTPWMKIWGGTESDYQSLTPDSNTAYLLLANQPSPWRLPSEYQEVEYIESSSKWPYIDTGVTYNTNGRVFQIKHGWTVGWDSNALFGNFTSRDESVWHTRYSSSTAWAFEWDCYAWNGYWRIVYTWTTVSIREIELWNNYIKDIPTDTVLVNWNTWSYTNSNSTMKIWYVDWILDWYMTFKLYYFKIIDNWTAIRDFVPCYRKADLVVGLYDLVNDQFYTNNWTWSFTKWPNVN